MIRTVVVMCVLGLVACSGGDKGGTRQEVDIVADSSGDIFVPSDTREPDSAPDTAPEASVETDADPNCNTFGCHCNSNADCLDELCIEGQDGFVCTKVCALECPQGYDCLTATGFGPDALSLCVPRHVPLCRPCMDSGDCAGIATNPGYCLPAANPDEGRFCGTGCGDGVSCPDGYSCDTVVVDGGSQVQQCRPISGVCECQPGWATQPYETSCLVANDIGRCAGTRSCGPDGLRACSGTLAKAESCNRQDDDCNGVTDDLVPSACQVVRGDAACPGVTGCVDGAEQCVGNAPAVEACNGIDDDCDGATDESTCFDGLTCTNDVCAAGECSNALVLGACVIDGVCYEAGDTKPDDLCQTCQPNVSTTSFTLAEAIACDDFNACTQDDTCRSGTCAGTPYVCDDGLACTRDACDGQGGCTEPLLPNNCLIESVCYANGTKKTPTSCEVCDATTSTSGWSGSVGGPCSDDDPCTKDDACDGSCHGTAFSCDDGDPCTVDACDGTGGCTNAVAASRCNIGGVCYAAGAIKEGEPCFVCDPTKDDEAWSAASPGASCDDGNACTSNDVCNSGICRGVTYACDDGLTCTINTCDGAGGCFVEVVAGSCVVEGACVVAGARSAPGSCLGCAPEIETNGWSALDGQTCDDDEECTSGDTCAAEVCAGTSYTCDDANACTVDRCNGDGTCANTQAATSCIIAGACYAADAKKPGEACLACRPEVSTTQWSPVVPNTICDDGNACTSNDLCNAGVCGGTGYSCNDQLACTSDSCDGAGGCVNAVNAGACVIEGVCFVAGALPIPGDCRVCDPSLSNTSWSARTGQGCDDGTECTKDDVCVGTECQGTSYTCNDDVACTTDSCDGDGTCTFALVQDACLIGGACYPDGAQKANEPCYACRPEIGGTTWSPALVGTECDDRNACTSEDECSNGLCAGTPYVCNDGFACTNDACTGDGECAFTIAPNNCLIDGACVAAGTVKTAGGCLWCDPTADARAWSAHNGAACNDGKACTSSDTCSGSSCVGTTYSCNDNLGCTADSCNGDGTCANVIQLGACVIGGACRADNEPKPGDVCLACRSSLANYDWRPAVGSPACSDGNACTKSDVCAAGICSGTAYICNDSKPCTTDSCNGDGTCSATIDLGSCLISGTCVDDGVTQGSGQAACLVCDSEVSQQSWTPNSGAPCNDGVACTSGDHCTGSTCGGESYSCNDSNACTLDSCNGSGGCSNVQAPSTCIIGGQCYAANFPKPGEPCFACRPDINASTWSAVAAGASCNDGNSCTKTDVCNAGSCAGTAYVCNDGLNCTADSCDGAGGCGTTINAGSCRIDGMCHANGALQTVGGCLVCAAATSQTTWSANTGASCNDGVACTKTDVCSGSTCSGTAYSCDDSLTCTSDSCNGGGGCSNAQMANTCLIGGVCYAPNAMKAGDPCLQCRPDLSPTAWSPVAGTNVACSDGLICTSGDKCNAGSCSGTPYICNDGLTCTTDSCDGAGSCNADVTTGCAIAGQCIAANATDPSNPCKVCTPALNKTGWSNKAAGTSCNDGNLCTYTDQCNAAGVCGGTAYSCNDNLSCTTDVCTGVQNGCTNTVNVGCKIGNACVATGADNPSNPCQECNPGQSPTSYTAGNNGATCNDNNACSHTDRCGSGICDGTDFTCDDGKTCTTNVCNGNNTCSYPLIGGNCLIGGACFANNTTNPDNICQKCSSGTPTSWSNNNVSCNDGTSCTTSDVCSGGVCDGTDVLDPYEPNAASRGRRITDVDDCDDPGEHSLQATLYPMGDHDWFYYYDDDRFGCSIYPEVSLVNIPVNSDYDLEVFFECADGSGADVSCSPGTDIGNGCKSAASGNTSERVRLNPNCSGSDDSGYVIVHVYRFSGSETCSSYTLQWGDN